MNLKRYNDWLIALGGTAVAGLAVFGIGRLIYEAVRPSYPLHASPGIALNAPTDKLAKDQQLVYCTPILIPGTDTQLIPVATYSPKEPSALSSVQYDRSMNALIRETSTAEILCPAPGAVGQPRAFNLIVRNSQTDETRLLLSSPAQIFQIHVPAAECKPADSGLPCDAILLSIRDADSNKDGVLDEEDPPTLYVTDLSLKTLHRVSKPNSRVLSWTWDARSKTLLLLVSGDGGKDTSSQLLGTRGPEWLPANPVVPAGVRESLQQALR